MWLARRLWLVQLYCWDCDTRPCFVEFEVEVRFYSVTAKYLVSVKSATMVEDHRLKPTAQCQKNYRFFIWLVQYYKRISRNGCATQWNPAVVLGLSVLGGPREEVFYNFVIVWVWHQNPAGKVPIYRSILIAHPITPSIKVFDLRQAWTKIATRACHSSFLLIKK